LTILSVILIRDFVPLRLFGFFSTRPLDRTSNLITHDHLLLDTLIVEAHHSFQYLHNTTARRFMNQSASASARLSAFSHHLTTDNMAETKRFGTSYSLVVSGRTLADGFNS
jgi:hypothetical protein